MTYTLPRPTGISGRPLITWHVFFASSTRCPPACTLAFATNFYPYLAKNEKKGCETSPVPQMWLLCRGVVAVTLSAGTHEAEYKITRLVIHNPISSYVAFTNHFPSIDHVTFYRKGYFVLSLQMEKKKMYKGFLRTKT